MTFNIVLILIFLCFFGFLLISLFFKRPKYGVDLPPSPPSLPIIGHLHLLSFLPHKSFHKLSSKYGPFLHLRFFNFPIILVSSAPVAYEIFRAHDQNVSSRNLPTIKGSLVFDTSGFITAPYGEYWKLMKKLVVTKIFGPHAQQQSLSIRTDERDRFYRNLLVKATNKESVDIGKEARKLMGNILCRTTMGRSYTEEKDEAESVGGLLAKANGSKAIMLLKVFLFRQLEDLGISLFKKDITGVSKKLDELLESTFVEHKEKPNKDRCTDIMDVLLEVYEDEHAEYKISMHNIKAFFVEIIFGGLDSSVNSIQWTMAEIINSPIIIARLREEIDLVVGKSRLIQETDLPNLPYLQAVIKEGLRLHPPVPLIPREFQQECRIGGFFVPKKTKLIVNVYALMRDPNFWEDPLEFKPERFLTFSRSGQEGERNEQVLKYLPFGSGRRGCPASNLAYMIVGTTIGMMVQCFDWGIKGQKVKMGEWFQGFDLTMAHPLKLTPATRISNFELKTSPNLPT